MNHNHNGDLTAVFQEARLIELSFQHPNTGRIYHRELWEVPSEIAEQILRLLQSDDYFEVLSQDECLDEDHPISAQLKELLSDKRVRNLAYCNPKAIIPVYWKRPEACACECDC